jgi:hypothetical protein
MGLLDLPQKLVPTFLISPHLGQNLELRAEGVETEEVVEGAGVGSGLLGVVGPEVLGAAAGGGVKEST